MAQQKTELKVKKKKKSLYRTRELHVMLIPAGVDYGDIA